MPTVYPTAAGTWSTRTWNDDATGLPYGGPPLSGDVVLANGLSITIDQNITVLEIATRAGTTAITGGSFTNNTGRTINGNITAGTSTCLTHTSGVLTLVGNVVGGAATNAIGLSSSSATGGNITGNVTGGSVTGTHGLSSSSSTFTITGNVTGGSGGHGVSLPTSIANLNVNGVVTAGSATAIYGIHATASFSNITINGNLVQSAFASAILTNNAGVTLNLNLTSNHISASTFPFVTVSLGNLILTGNIAGGSSTNHVGLSIAAAARCRIIGDVTGGSAAGATAVLVVTTASTSSTVHVIGNVTGGTNATAHGISMNSQGSFFVHGGVTGGSLGNAIHYINAPRVTDFVALVGNIIGGSVSGFGVSAPGFCRLYVFGTSTNSGGLAFSGGVTAVVTPPSSGPTSSILAHAISF